MATAETNLGRVTFVAEGVFDPNKTDYKRLGVVVLDGNSYQATVDNPTGIPQLDGSNPDWQLIAQKGEDGQDGEDGASAYEIAVDEGFEGTEIEWLTSLIGPQGEQGSSGWTAVFATVIDGERRVHQIVDWVNGQEPKPSTGLYLGPLGLTPNIAEATNVRGAMGPSGSGTGDMTKEAYDPRDIGEDVFDRSNHTGTQVISTIDGLEDAIDGAVPYTGATSGVDLGSQDLAIDGVFMKNTNALEINFLYPGTSELQLRKLSNVANLSRNIDTSTESDIVITLPEISSPSSKWHMKVVILQRDLPYPGRVELFITAASTNNNRTSVSCNVGAERIGEVKFGIVGSRPTIIIKLAGLPNHFSYGKVIIEDLYTTVGYPGGHWYEKENYNIDYINEEDIVGLTVNNIVTNAEFTRDPFYLDYNNFVNTPTIPAAQVNSDWDATSGVAQILNKPTTIAGFGITDAYTQNQINDFIDNKVDKVTGLQLSQESYTTLEKTKLTGIATGATANATDAQLRARASHTGEQAISTITGLQASLDSKVTVVSGKQLSDENYTLSEKNKLASITAIFTTALKTTYDSAVSWVSTNGANVLAHLSSTSNPHGVTKAQVGLGSVDNTSDLAKPISIATQNALNNKATLGTATTEVRDNQQLDERYLQPYTVKTPTISFTLGAANKNDYLIASSNITITMPADLSTTDYPIGSTTNVRVSTGATVNFTGASGVTLDHPDGTGNVSVEGRKVVSIVRVDTNAYDLIY